MCHRRQYSFRDLEKYGRWKFSMTRIPRASERPIVMSIPPVKSA